MTTEEIKIKCFELADKYRSNNLHEDVQFREVLIKAKMLAEWVLKNNNENKI